MQDLIERLKLDLNEPSKESEPFILNWTEAVIRRLWTKAQIGEASIDAELIDLGKAAASRCKRKKYVRTRLADNNDRSLEGWSKIILGR